MFTEYPTYARYRTLRLTTPVMQGEDVFALQTALEALGFLPGSSDGVLGADTAHAIVDAQRFFKLVQDGFAGGATQEALARRHGNLAKREFDVADGLMRGQIEHESSFRLGNYSPQRPDGSYDAGPVQRNTEHTPAELGFNVPVSIKELASNTRKHYDLFAGVSEKRRWQLAGGAWNAPAYACWIANEEGAKVDRRKTNQPGTDARAKIEAYMASISTYLSV